MNQCQGVIINKWQVLTAAHCIIDDEIRIVSGTSIIRREFPMWQPYRTAIENMTKIFPLFEEDGLIYDIGIITVNKVFDFNHKLLRPIKMATMDQVPKGSIFETLSK